MAEVNPLLCFDLSYQENLKIFIPNAYIANQKTDGIGYILKNANANVLRSYKIQPSEVEQQLLKICDLLQLEALTTKFNTKTRHKKELTVLLTDKKLKVVFNQYVHGYLKNFLVALTQHKLPLAINVDKRDPFYVHQISYAENELVPLLQFDKSEAGIVYTLQLKDQQKKFFPFTKKVTVILNQPGWVVINQKLFKLQNINGKKLNPFLDKKSVEIAPQNTQIYFEHFIKDIAKKVDIVAKGFKLIEKQEFTKCYIEPLYHLLTNSYVLHLKYEYNEVVFYSSEIRKSHVSLELDEAKEFYIVKTKRDSVIESTLIDKLKNSVFHEFEKGLFRVKNPDLLEDNYGNVHFLLQQKEQLEALGFHISNFEIDQKNILPVTGTIQSNVSEKTDWFDVDMQINCGDFQFPFSKIVNHIKTGDRFYELPDATYFLIPEPWFTTYKPIVQFAKTDGNLLKIQKNQFTLLELIQPEKKK